MTLQQLEYVVALDKYRHFVTAAESCNITQSTLSSMLKKLEEELDIIIFDRNSHPIHPTRAGEEIIKQAKVVLFHARQLQELSLDERQKKTGNIRLGVTATIAPYIMPKLFKYVKGYPNLTMKASELYRDTIVKQLKTADLDMAIMSLPEQDEDLLEIPLYKERVLAFVSPSDPLYEEKEIDFSTMPRERFWTLKHEICFQRQISGLHYCESEHGSMYESGNVPTLLWIVEENGGFTAIPELHVPLIREEHRCYLRPFVNPVPIREVSLFVRNDYVHEGLLQVIIDGIKEIIPKEMQNDHLKKFGVRI